MKATPLKHHHHHHDVHHHHHHHHGIHRPGHHHHPINHCGPKSRFIKGPLLKPGCGHIIGRPGTINHCGMPNMSPYTSILFNRGLHTVNSKRARQGQPLLNPQRFKNSFLKNVNSCFNRFTDSNGKTHLRFNFARLRQLSQQLGLSPRETLALRNGLRFPTNHLHTYGS
ncbi:MAG: hypothetical protein KDK66_04080 [Deltaproteobacteria bacterium]|nr:hypothetical protein [Deltaproteobacteria bacterium]